MPITIDAWKRKKNDRYNGVPQTVFEVEKNGNAIAFTTNIADD